MNLFYISLNQDKKTISDLIAFYLAETNLTIFEEVQYNTFVRFEDTIAREIAKTENGSVIMTDKFIILPVNNIERVYVYDEPEATQ